MHHSLLPRHRGPNPIQWALIQEIPPLGLLVHVMGVNFDDGEIIE